MSKKYCPGKKDAGCVKRIDNPYFEMVKRDIAEDRGLVKGKYEIHLKDYYMEVWRDYCWGILPTNEDACMIASYSPLVEIGAGSGYWAYLITQAGGIVDSYDIIIPAEGAPEFINLEIGRIDRMYDSIEKILPDIVLERNKMTFIDMSVPPNYRKEKSIGNLISPIFLKKRNLTQRQRVDLSRFIGIIISTAMAGNFAPGSETHYAKRLWYPVKKEDQIYS